MQEELRRLRGRVHYPSAFWLLVAGGMTDERIQLVESLAHHGRIPLNAELLKWVFSIRL
jgi:hypothetical protein